jgi:hypothetical protein
MTVGARVKYNRKAIRTFGCDDRDRGTVERVARLGPRAVLFVRWDSDGIIRKTGPWLLQEIK